MVRGAVETRMQRQRRFAYIRDALAREGVNEAWPEDAAQDVLESACGTASASWEPQTLLDVAHGVAATYREMGALTAVLLPLQELELRMRDRWVTGGRRPLDR